MIRVVAFGFVLLTAAPVFAQTGTPALRPHRFTVSGGVGWLGGYGIGSRAATLRRNEPGTTTPGPLTLFNADGAIEAAAAVEARLGFTVTPEFAIELGGAYSRPTVAVEVAGDSEAGGARLADQREAQYVIDASALWQLSRLRLGNRTRPYVTAGGGYLRQLDLDRVKAETGKLVYVGGGFRYWLRGGDARSHALGLRGEARAQFRSGGLDFEGKTRMAPAATIFLFFAF